MNFTDGCVVKTTVATGFSVPDFDEFSDLQDTQPVERL